MRNQQDSHFEAALLEWSSRSGYADLAQNQSFQSEWDKPMYEHRFLEMIQSTKLEAEKARLLSISAESGSIWLHAIPIPSLGLHLDPMSLKIACGLHLGAKLCHSHRCICGEMVDPMGRHGLSCKKQKVR